MAIEQQTNITTGQHYNRTIGQLHNNTKAQ